MRYQRTDKATLL